MKMDCDENVLNYWNSPNGNYILEMKKTRDYMMILISKFLRALLGTFILSKSKRNMNDFIWEINGFFNSSFYYGDTDSLYNEKKYWDVLDKTKLVGEELCHGKNDYKTGGICYGLFLAPTDKYVLSMDEFVFFNNT